MNDLLKVLDMSEKEQRKWLLVHYFKQRMPHESTADLAFRLRDEVIAEDDKSEIDCSWCEASYEVYLYVIGEENEMEAKEGLDTWFSMRAKPIHWIIAALIAKEQK
ncbi:hypothetical protein LCGC14_2738100 [marine sediment metagenome]|uniref:Uncharacterized protein n=1 Tax=marine sediment metagenome TaxID=412755 RepID=A0A0F9BE99_9ZZZZ